MNKVKKILNKIFKQPLWTLGFCMIVVLVFSLFANMANTSMYQVKVTKVNFDTEGVYTTIKSRVEIPYEGNIEGWLYTPKGCDKNNPCPVIVLTHGYLNSKEMQDAPTIEMSKRGYIVLAVDMYDHGESIWNTPWDPDMPGFGFYMNSLWDTVKWVYDQPYTLKDPVTGNGMIAVSGHSMGGYSSELAVAMDAAYAPYQGHRKIAVSLAVGADYRYSDAGIIDAYGDRSSGMIIGHYDEFFGDPTDGNENTVSYKDYLETEQGKAFLGGGTNLDKGEEYKAGKIYNFAGGQRVIYTPNETHPWNHFSTETTGNMIDFYDAAFAYQLEKANLTSAFDANDTKGQTWWLKEAFEFIAMIALFGAIIPAFNLLTRLPFFAKVRTEEEAEKETVEPVDGENKEEAAEESSEPVEEIKEEKVEKAPKAKKYGLILIALITSLIPAWFFETFINRGSGLADFTMLANYIIRISILVAVSTWIVYIGVKMVKGDDDEKARKVALDTTKASIIVGLFALFLRFVSTTVATDSLNLGYYYNAPTANDIGYWAIICASISLLIISIVHFTIRKREGATMKDYGLKASFVQVLIALLISVILFVGIYLVVFLIDLVFKTDFRLWVYAIKSFEWHHFVSFLRYVPIYFIFYFVNSIVVASNTKDVKGWKGYLYAITLNIGGLVLLLAVQYGKLFITGTAALPGLALNGILLFGLIPSLAVAAIFAKKFAEKTNNIWTSAFFNTFLFTMIALANTAICLFAK